MIYGISDKIMDRMTINQLLAMYNRTSPAFLQKMSNYRFRKIVQWVAEHSAFYKAAFKQHGINPARVNVPADLGDFYTTPDDIIKNPEAFICSKPSIVFESSGTSGKNKQIYFDKSDLEKLSMTMASGLRLMGVGPDDRVANGFDFSIWIPGMVFQLGLFKLGTFNQAFGKVDPIEVYRRIEQYKLNVILGEPTWLIRLTELAEKHGRHKLKLLIGGAEEMPADAIGWMKEVWGGATVKMCYGSVELGSGLGFQPCPNHDGYHIDNVNFYPEILDPDEDGYGEIVFTTLRRRVMPLIRYRTRDVSRIMPDLCSCGLTAPRLAKLRGRRDDMVVASGGNLYPLMFENILRGVPGLTHDWQVVFSLDGVREVMDIRVETTRTDIEILQKQVHVQASDLYPDLMKNLALAIFRMKVTACAPGSIRVGRKLRRMIDIRHHQHAPVEETQKIDDLTVHV